MKNPLVCSLLGCFSLAALQQPAPARPASPGQAHASTNGQLADPIFASSPRAARRLPLVVSQPVLDQYLRTVPTRIRAAAKTRNVEFMPDCLAALTQHVREFSAEGQRTGLTLTQIQDNNGAFVQKVVDTLRDAYDKEEEAEHRNDPKNPRTGKSIREEAEIYQCGLKNYLPLFNNLMAAKPVVTILTQPDAAQVFMAQATGYRSLGASRLTKALPAGLYTLVFTKPGYQSIRRTLAAQRIPVQVFRTTLSPLAVAR